MIAAAVTFNPFMIKRLWAPMLVIALAARTPTQCLSAAWVPLGNGIGSNPAVEAILALPNGDILAGGNFFFSGGAPATGIASWNGQSWSAPFPASWAGVQMLALQPSGTIIAGGAPGVMGNPNQYSLAQWTGNQWQSLPVGGGSVFCSARLPSGDLVVGGSFTGAGTPFHYSPCVARWNGSTWQSLGITVGGEVRSLAVRPNGNIVAGGYFFGSYYAGAVFERPTSGGWNPVGPAFDNTVMTVLALPGGGIVAGGYFSSIGGTPANHIALWDGSAWQQLGSGFNSAVTCLALMSNGDILAGGSFTSAGSVPVSRLAVWTGAEWSAIGSGVNGGVSSIALSANGNILVGGYFSSAGTTPANGIVTRAPCPAGSSLWGIGCPGSGGNNVLAASTLPISGGTFHATGTELALSAFVLAVSSVVALAPPLDLSLVFAESPAGCRLYVSPDILELVTAFNGSAHSSLFIPSTPSAVGVAFFHQMIPLETNPQGGVVEITATNALRLLIGEY